MRLPSLRLGTGANDKNYSGVFSFSSFHPKEKLVAIQQLNPQEVDQVSGAGLLTPLAVALGINPTGLLAGGGGTLGLGGLFRGLFTGIPLLGPLLIQLESLI